MQILKNKVLALQWQFEKAVVNEIIGKFCLHSRAADLSLQCQRFISLKNQSETHRINITCYLKAPSTALLVLNSNLNSLIKALTAGLLLLPLLIWSKEYK